MQEVLAAHHSDQPAAMAEPVQEVPIPLALQAAPTWLHCHVDQKALRRAEAAARYLLLAQCCVRHLPSLSCMPSCVANCCRQQGPSHETSLRPVRPSKLVKQRPV